MERVADGLFLLAGRPRHAIDVYLMGDVLVDAATRQARRRILRQLRGRPVHGHALTHVHPDHQGALTCFGHGPPLRDPSALRAVVERPER
jgi:hydroxyacylglutathione hydrolase